MVREVRKADEAQFILFPLSARPGIIPPPCHGAHQLFLEWPTNPCSDRRATLLFRFELPSFLVKTVSFVSLPQLPSRLGYTSPRPHARLSNCFHRQNVLREWLLSCPDKVRAPLTSSRSRHFFLCCAGRRSPVSFAQQVHLHPAKAGDVEIWSRGPQQKRGDLFLADGDVDIHYGDERLQADHVEYNEQTSESVARGHVRFDYNNEHLEADEARYNISTGHGLFTNVRGTVKIGSSRQSRRFLFLRILSISRLPRSNVSPTTSTSSAAAGSPSAILAIPSGSFMLRRRAFVSIRASPSSTPIFASSVFLSSGFPMPPLPPAKKFASLASSSP